MKHILIIIIAAFSLSSFVAASPATISDIVNALKQGNASNVSNYFDNFIDIKLPNKEEAKNISKNQATQTLKDFYSEQEISSFELTSQRELGGTGYLTGKLKSDKHSFNITIMVKSKGNQSTIVSVRIN